MNRYYLLSVILLIIGCKQGSQDTPMLHEDTSDEVIVYKEYMGEEPTEPEQTEFYEPVPPIVNDGRIMQGKPIRLITSWACSIECAISA